MKKITILEEFMELEKSRVRMKVKRQWVGRLMLLDMVFIIAFTLLDWRALALCSYLLFVPVLLRLFLIDRKLMTIVQEKWDILDTVSPSLRELSRQLYGGDEWMAAAIECSESHMRGDCPLCGAA